MKKTEFPPTTEDVYSRFNDDGWGICNIKRTKEGSEILKRLEEAKNDKRKAKD